jgi:adenylate cyclase
LAVARDRRRRADNRAELTEPGDGAGAGDRAGETGHGSQRAAAREAGEAALARFRRTLLRTAAELIRSDPADAATALEVGLVDRKWLEAPGEHPISTTTPFGLVERFLERSVERRPSRLSSLGLSAIQVLGAPSTDGALGTREDLAIVFTDLEGFTAFTETHGDDAALATLEDHYQRAGPLVRSFSGHIVKRLGDGLLCTFADASLGLGAALEMLELAPPPLSLRAGMHVGSALVSRRDVIGQVVNIAARVAETAKGGQVAITDEAAAAAGEVPGARIGRSRPRRLKGISDPVGVRIVTSTRLSES